MVTVLTLAGVIISK